MTLLKKQKHASFKRGMPVEVLGSGKVATPVTGETVQLQYFNSGVLTNDAGQAIGTVVVGAFAKAPLLDALGGVVGNEKDSSLSFTSTALTTEVALPTGYDAHDHSTLEARANAITNGMSDGEYCVDYIHGIIYGKKASTTATLTSTAYSYPSQELNADLTVDGAEVDESNPVPVYDVVAGISQGFKDVASAGTAEALVGVSTPCKYVWITAKRANTGYIAFGNASVVAANNGANLAAGEGVVVPVPGQDLQNLYIDATVSAEGITFSPLT